MLHSRIYCFCIIIAVSLNVNGYYLTSYKRSCGCDQLLNDPLWFESWFLHPESTKPSMKIVEAWREGYSGKGVVVTVIDDGIEYTHPDLKENYDPKASYDVNGNDEDPIPRYDATDENRVGTRIAGLISASANNSVCSAGVAYKASIGGIRLLDGDVSDRTESQALRFAQDYIDIYVSAWGPDDDGKTTDGPGIEAKKAIEDGILNGRNGKGSIYVWGSGNGGRQDDDCNRDGYTNSIYTIGIGSVSDDGKKTWYGERCSALLAVTYSSGGSLNGKMFTTNIRGRCTNQATGTSASVGLAAGICALALEANPALTWRDMQHLIVRTANPEGLISDDWFVNAAGRNVSRTFGFGLMDAHAMVTQAKNWVRVPKQRSCRITVNHPTPGKKWFVSERYPLLINIPTSKCDDGGILPDKLEHVEVMMNVVGGGKSGTLSVHLISPWGTKSTMLGVRKRDVYGRGLSKWNFTSVQFWDENPINDWMLRVERLDYGTVKPPISLTLYGTLEEDRYNREPSTTNQNIVDEANTNSSTALSGLLNVNAYYSTSGKHCNCYNELNDVWWEKMWYLHPETQPSMKVLEAWKEGYSGEGVVLTVIDDGLEHTHPDLTDNYDPNASYDINGNDEDPMPRQTSLGENRLGTRMAGFIAASANNSICSAGVAYKASVGGIRLLDGDVTDMMESTALSFIQNYVDIYVSAWGPADDGRTKDGPGLLAKKAIEDGIQKGRNGKGSIYIWGTGNGGKVFDDCNCDGYANSIYTIGIGSVSSDGKKPWYGETCSAIMAVTYGSGGPLHGKMVSTDVNGGCTDEATGNSASVSLAAGICALALEANPELTWRDMQHLIVRTANTEGLISDDWFVNAAGRNVSRTFGFGMMNAHAMVMQAKNWVRVPKQRICKITVKPRIGRKEWYVNIRNPLIIKIPTFKCDDGGILPDKLEHVEVMVNTVGGGKLGTLSIHLISPWGTKSTLLDFRTKDDNYRGFYKWNFRSVQFWGENPINDWRLRFERLVYGTVRQPLSLTLYGTLEEDWTTQAPTKDSTTTQSVTNTTPPPAPIQLTTDTTAPSTTVHPTFETSAPLSTFQSTPDTTAASFTTLSDGDIIAKKMLRDFKYIICKTRCNVLKQTSRGTETCTCVY